MTKRRPHRFALWLLPLLLLKGLVPVGFMLDVSSDNVAMIVCPGHHSVPSGGEQHKPTPSSESGLVCPFAAASGAATLNSVASLSLEPLVVSANVPTDSPSFDLPFGPRRVQQSRAPPTLLT